MTNDNYLRFDNVRCTIYLQFCNLAISLAALKMQHNITYYITFMHGFLFLLFNKSPCRVIYSMVICNSAPFFCIFAQEMEIKPKLTDE